MILIGPNSALYFTQWSFPLRRSRTPGRLRITPVFTTSGGGGGRGCSPSSSCSRGSGLSSGACSCSSSSGSGSHRSSLGVAEFELRCNSTGFLGREGWSPSSKWYRRSSCLRVHNGIKWLMAFLRLKPCQAKSCKQAGGRTRNKTSKQASRRAGKAASQAGKTCNI